MRLGVHQIAAGGTRDASTFLRGDGTWATPPGGGGSSSSWPPGSADAPPAVSNAKDDEFDGTSSASWAATPTAPAQWVVNTDRASHLHLQATSAQAANTVGKVQAVPGAYPYKITTKLAGHSVNANFSLVGLLLAPAGTLTATSLMMYFGPQFNSGTGNLAVRRGSNNFGGTGTFTQTVSASFVGNVAVYLRLVVNSATSVDLQASADGFAWATVQGAFNPGFTPGAMGLCASYNSGATVDAYFDFFRIT